MDAWQRVLDEIVLAVDQAGGGRVLVGIDGGERAADLAEALVVALRDAGREASRVASEAPVRAGVLLAADEVADVDEVLVVAGRFLHRPDVAALWDVSVFLDAPDRGSPEVVAYLAECRPAHLATVVVDLSDVEAPQVVAGSDVDELREDPGSP